VPQAITSAQVLKKLPWQISLKPPATSQNLTGKRSGQRPRNAGKRPSDGTKKTKNLLEQPHTVFLHDPFLG
jgi:hypothetical protein